ncbi:MAG: sulfatase-like hydrolase/transferase [Proteobacteria bacterium]|nr:sulfatase-like hydrolase/transferase [Pseudomonadota bacterium]
MPETQRPSGRWSPLLLFLAVWLPTLIVRIRLWIEEDVHFSPVVDLRGLAADLALAIPLALFFAALPARRRWLAGPLVAVWALLQHANAEYVLSNGAEFDYRYAGLAATPTFVFGSITAVLWSWWTPAVLAPALGLWPIRETKPRPEPRWLLVPLALAAVLSVWPANWEHQGWRQRHVVMVNLHTALSHRPVEYGDSKQYREVEDALTGDLSGELILPQATGPRNIVVVLLEGFTGGHLPSTAAYHDADGAVTMPLIDAMGDDNVRFHTVVHQQRQSNRGNYAMFCGDYPALDSGSPKAIAMTQGAERRCFPQILSDHGYTTAFMHPGNLQFMSFDGFAAKAGYSDIFSIDHYSRGRPHNAWGPDDGTFIRQSTDRILAYHQEDEPFLAVLFTTGTHHPYAVPAEFEPQLADRARAFAFADRAVQDMMDRLRENGVLEDTLVILTSDEASGIKDIEQAARKRLSQSWAPMVWVMPEPAAAEISAPYLSSDLSLSLLDYLQLTSEGPHFVGRSMLRNGPADRWLAFSNTLLRRSFLLSPDGSLLECNRVGEDCSFSALNPDQIFGPEREALPVEGGRKDLLFSFFDETSRVGDTARTNHFEFHRKRAFHLQKGEYRQLFGGQFIDLPKDKDLEIALHVEGEFGDGTMNVGVSDRGGTFLKMTALPLRAGDSQVVNLRMVNSDREYRQLVFGIRGRPSSRRMAMRVRKATLDVVEPEEHDGRVVLDWQPTMAGWSEPLVSELTEAECTGDGCSGGWSATYDGPPEAVMIEVSVLGESLGPLRLVLRQGNLERSRELRIRSGGRGILMVPMPLQPGELHLEMMPSGAPEPRLRPKASVDGVRIYLPER